MFSTNILPVATAYATQPVDNGVKVFVCKYVGTPGVNEALQTGDNPISVSSNATGGTAVGSYFSDQQGRSFVLVVDSGQPEPNVNTCPPPQGPTTIAVPTVPVVDPCGLANAVYGTVPAGSYSVQLNADGSITLTANTGFVFTGGLAAVTLPAPTDSGTLCPVEPTVITVPTVPVTDPCGPANAVYGTVPAGSYSVQLNADGSITLTANTGFVFTGGLAAVTLPAPTDSNVACPVDVCPNLEGIQLTVPQGMEINNDGNCVDKKVTICHRTNAVTNPYVKISVSTNAADGVAGNSGGQPDHYGEHQGPVFDPNTEYPAPHNGDQWGDIIPPIEGAHGGLNWSTEGQAIYNNDCNVPSEVDVCPNIEGIQLTVPEGLVQDNEGNCITDVCPLVPGVQTDTILCPPGQGGGHVLGTTTTAAQLPATLPATGGEQSGPLALVLAMITAYGAAYFLQGRRQLNSARE